MSRFKRVAHGVASGYVLLAVTSVYALASLPLALHYLTKERFGLWGLMASISGYLSLIDLGMSGAVARLLIDHKDDRNKGTYGSLIKTGWVVLCSQGFIIFSIGVGIAPLLRALLKIEPGLSGEFIQLMRWQAAGLGLTFGTRIFSHLLQAHQRIDISNYSSMSALVINFACQWLFFHAGFGVFSLVWATMIGAMTSAMISLSACWLLDFFPANGSWGEISYALFKELFAYGKDMFLVALGTQMIMASQNFIITRQLGLVASGVWYAATRTFNLISQAVWRISDFSGPALSEMIARGEQPLLRRRYESVVTLSASAAGYAAVSFALCNSLFVRVYTARSGNTIVWPAIDDVYLGIWMIVMAVLHCHNCFVLLTKKIAFMRYVYFIEGVVFVAASLITIRYGGIPAMILCSVLCSALFSGAYGIWRIADYFDLSITEVAIGWVSPMARLLALYAPTAAILWFATSGVQQPVLRLAIHTMVCATLGLFLFVRLGLARDFKAEIVNRAPKRCAALLRKLFCIATPSHA
jgi:O-antigen/teichoic acid export membrane protein